MSKHNILLEKMIYFRKIDIKSQHRILIIQQDIKRINPEWMNGLFQECKDGVGIGN